MLHLIRIHKSFRHNFIPTNPRHNLRPENPVNDTEQQNTDADDREDVVRVPVSIPIAIRRNERRDCEEDIGGQVEHCNGQEGVPGRSPVLALLVVQVDETGGDKAVDPGTGVGVQVDDEVVSWACWGCDKDDDGDEPVEEEL